LICGRRAPFTNQPAVSVVIPAFNEERMIGQVLVETANIMDCLNVPYEIIVVDDGSTDQTGLVASGHKVLMVTNKTNRGKGYSIRRALQYAQGDIIVTMDSDGEHQPKEIPSLIEPLYNGTDIVAGSRFLGANGNRITTRINRIGNFLFNFTIMSITGKYITDSQTGFRAIKRSVINELQLESDGYEIETEITLKSLRNGYTFKELPVTVKRRRYDQSKIRLVHDGAKIMKTMVKASIQK
jgi:glycosyltransferase involved in cell wall biosynthesis